MIEVINKTLPFHVSTSYQIQVEGVYANDVHSDIVLAIANISSTQYASEFGMHLDLSAAFKAVNDGHFGWSNFCYVSPNQSTTFFVFWLTTVVTGWYESTTF